MFKSSDEFRRVTWWREEIPTGRFWVLCILVLLKFKYTIPPPKIIMFRLELQKSLPAKMLNSILGKSRKKSPFLEDFEFSNVQMPRREYASREKKVCIQHRSKEYQA